jgi:hypothetical protein
MESVTMNIEQKKEKERVESSREFGYHKETPGGFLYAMKRLPTQILVAATSNEIQLVGNDG